MLKLPSQLNFQNLIISSTHTPLLSSKISCMSGFVSLADESGEEGEACRVMTEKSELEVVHSWLQVVGQPAWAEEEAKGLLCEVFPFA